LSAAMHLVPSTIPSGINPVNFLSRDRKSRLWAISLAVELG
jgi:hypothetical protein